MTTIYNLVRLQLNNSFAFFRKRKWWQNAAILVIVWFILYSLKTILTYATRSLAFKGVQMSNALLVIIITFLTIITFILALSKIINMLYLNRDNEILMSFPATHNEVFYSKIITIYIYETIANALFSIPILWWFGVEGNQGMMFFVHLFTYLLVVPLLIIIVAGIISIPVMMIITFLKTRFRLMIAVIVILSGATIILYSRLISQISLSFNIVDKQVETMLNFNQWVQDTAPRLWGFRHLADLFIGDHFLQRLAIITAVMVAGGFISILAVSKFYFRLAMTASETGARRARPVGKKRWCFAIKRFKKLPYPTLSRRLIPLAEIRSRRYQVNSSFYSILKKEVLMIFRNPNYVFQYFMFTLLMPFVVVAYNQFLKDITVNQYGKAMILASHVLIIAIFSMLSNIISANLVSLEGGSFYIMKTSPIALKKQVLVKIIFNLLVTTIAVFITSLSVIIFLRMNFIEVFAISLVMVVASVGLICLNFEMDLRRPSLSWYDSGEITSTSKTMSKAICYALLFGLIIGGVMFAALGLGNALAILAVLMIVSAFTAFRIYCLYYRIDLFFERIEI